MNIPAPALPTAKLSLGLSYWVGLLTYQYKGWTIERSPCGYALSKGELIEFHELQSGAGRGRKALYDLARTRIDGWDKEERCQCGTRLAPDSDGTCEGCWQRWERHSLTDS